MDANFSEIKLARLLSKNVVGLAVNVNSIKLFVRCLMLRQSEQMFVFPKSGGLLRYLQVSLFSYL